MKDKTFRTVSFYFLCKVTEHMYVPTYVSLIVIRSEMLEARCSIYTLWLLLCLYVVQGTTIVSTENGKLSGVKLLSRNGTPYLAYFGIPYAKPPTGDLRFQPPQDPDSWDGIRNEILPKQKCLQYDRFYISQGIGGSEDCLYLNVFTPIVNVDLNLPVMVCIHGGAFFRGDSADCFPHYFMDEEIVVVTFNYRLGILGFLSTADEVLPGNYGIKDQVAVLRWVKKNIKNFGGDANRVTIFGQSAGGASVHLHMYSPLSKGLFHRAISQSGSATVPWAVAPAAMARNKTFTLAQLTGCPLTCVQDLVLCLKKLPGEDLVQMFPKFFMWHYVPLVSFSVVVEPELEGAFLTKKPEFGEELHQVPWITGITSGEGAFAVAEFLSNGGGGIKEFNVDYVRLMPSIFFFDYNVEKDFQHDLSQIIKEEYFQNLEINRDNVIKLRNMITDGAFAHDVIKSALKYKGKRYFYLYDHLNDRSFTEIWGLSSTMKFLGVSHGDDLISFFPQLWMIPPTLNGKDLMLSIKLIKYWATFARTGNPNDDRILQSNWNELTGHNVENLNHLYIGESENIMKNSLLHEKYSFWEKLPLNNTADKYNTQSSFEQPLTEDTNSEFSQQQHNEL
ncbi:venom carboxylesterase-6-like [Planococcus citri]|uniref:venom carboxylesterase-6-like n=1 Tax=Planococcus citri TaxID=170843 RepID=UPI0031F953F4